MRLVDVLLARGRIAPYVRRTPLAPSTWLSDASGATVSLKLESLQRSGSFKIRGAFNAVLARLERAAGAPLRLVTASAGNHGRGLAIAARTFGLPLVVFTASDAARTKLTAIAHDGATLRSEARDYDEAERLAKAYARDEGAEYISPYSDADVIAGAATIALELFEDDPAVETIVAPIGGGGLISGLAIAAKQIAPALTVVGVEVEASCPFLTSIRAGRLVEIVPGPSLADGLVGNPDPETITFDLVQQYVDSIVTVSEADLANAVRGLVAFEHVIAEGAAAAAPAAIIGSRVDIRDRRTAVVLSGGNIDRERLAAVLAGA